MKLQKQKEIADVFLYDVEVSESELEIYQECMAYVLKHLNSNRIEKEFGAYPDEISGMIADIRDMLKKSGVHDVTESQAVELS